MDWCRRTSYAVLIVCFATVYGQELPQIAKEILPEIKRVGETGMLNCTISWQRQNKVYWTHGKYGNVITNDDKVDIDPKLNEIIDGLPKYDVYRHVDGDRTKYTLVIRRLQQNDAGTYVCSVQVLGTSSGPSKNGKMVVLIPPVIIQAQTSHTLTVQEGLNASLRCNATGFPTPNITWIRANGKALPPPLDKFSYRGHRLNLTSIQRGGRGVYRCIADNNVRPPASHDATLYIDFKPFAKAIQSSYGQAQNRLFDVTIECLVAGHPDPDLQWYQREGEGLRVINDDDKHAVHVMRSQNIGVSEFWFQLTIMNVQANDYGKYVCRGTNRLGHHDADVVVYETSECQGANCPAESGRFSTATVTKVSMITVSLLATLSYLWTR